jgi:hypothetical protein
MTPLILQEKLSLDIARIFKGDTFKDSQGKDVPLNIFHQYRPIRKDEDEPDPVPYAIVRILEGTVKGWTEAQEVQVMIILGCADDMEENSGHKTVLGMIQKIEERFMKNPMLVNQFMFLNDDQHPFGWALQDEESFPYFFGAISMTFKTAAIRTEDKYA